MRVIDIIPGTTVDGPGFRTSIYFAGCEVHCPGCHNPQSWDSSGGYEMSIDEIVDRIEAEDFDVTFSGGDPLLQPIGLTELATRLKEQGRNIWCYTGRLYEDLVTDPVYAPLLSLIDVLVDGPFIQSQRDTSLLFRGSSNQRLIDIAATISAGTIVLWRSDF